MRVWRVMKLHNLKNYSLCYKNDFGYYIRPFRK